MIYLYIHPQDLLLAISSRYMAVKSHRDDNFRFHSDGLMSRLYIFPAHISRADTDNLYLLFDLIRNVINQLLCIIPAKTRIRDGFSVNMLADLLAARL